MARPADPDPIVMVLYDPSWPEEFRGYAKKIRSALGSVALRIDHVGSTSVPGLDAKPIVDLQVSVRSLDPAEAYVAPLAPLGYTFQPENPDRTKRAFRWPPGQRRTHVYVRAAGSFDEQLNLLFRDYLRTHGPAAKEYAAVKWSLAERFRNDREGYVRAKEPTVWKILHDAHTWAQESAWSPGPSDA